MSVVSIRRKPKPAPVAKPAPPAPANSLAAKLNHPGFWRRARSVATRAQLGETLVSAVLRKLRTDDQALELLREIRDLLKRAEERRRSPAAVPMLIAALEERYGPSRFLVRMVLEAADEDPHGPLAEAVALVVDMNASAKSRATALLSRLPEVEVVAEQRGASIYRLRRP